MNDTVQHLLKLMEDGRTKNAIARARERFGRPFATEPGSNWRSGKHSVLTRWLACRLAGHDWQNVDHKS